MLRRWAGLIMPLGLVMALGTQSAQSQVIYRSTTVTPNRDYYYPQVGQNAGSAVYGGTVRNGTIRSGTVRSSTVRSTVRDSTIRDSRIQDSTLVRPVVIDSEIENSTLIDPVIVSPHSGVVRQDYPPIRSQGARCMLFSEIRQVCQ